MSESLYEIPPGCICMGDGLFGMKCYAPQHTRLKSDLRSELAAMEARALKAEAESMCDVCAGTGDPKTGKPCICDGTGKAHVAAHNFRLLLLKTESERDSLKARLEAAERVIAASRCIRHWHDTAQGGMIVSQEHVFELWAALEQYDAAMSEKEPKA